MKLSLFAVLASVLVLPLIASGEGGHYSSDCERAADEAKGQCIPQVAQYAKDEAAYGGATAAAAGKNITQNAGTQGSAVGMQDANIKNLIDRCQKAKAYCDKQCQTDKTQADQLVQTLSKIQPPSPQLPPAQKDAAQVPKSQKSECDTPLHEALQNLGANDSPLPDDGKKTDDSKQASSSAPPMGAPPGGGGGNGDKSADSNPSTDSCVNGTGTGCNNTTTPTTPASIDPTLPTQQDPTTGQTQFATIKPKDKTNPNDPTAKPEGTNPAAVTGPIASGGAAGASGGGGGLSGSAGAGATLATASVSKDGKPASNLPNIGSLSTEGGGGGGGGYSGSNNSSSDGGLSALAGEMKPPNWGAGKEAKPSIQPALMTMSDGRQGFQPDAGSLTQVVEWTHGFFCKRAKMPRKVMCDDINPSH